MTPANRALSPMIFVNSGLSRTCARCAEFMRRLTISGKTASYIVGEPFDAQTNLSRP